MIALYEQGHRADLAQQESDEIAVIESFLPRQMSEGEIAAAAQAAIAETGAAGIRKDMGKVMAALRERHAGGDRISAAPGRSSSSAARLGEWAKPLRSAEPMALSAGLSRRAARPRCAGRGSSGAA